MNEFKSGLPFSRRSGTGRRGLAAGGRLLRKKII